MTKYRTVERTTKGGSIKQHGDIDWIYYATFAIGVKKEKFYFSTTTRTLEEAETWIATQSEIEKQRLGYYDKKKKKTVR